LITNTLSNSEEGESAGLLGAQVTAFLGALRAAVYAEPTVKKKRLVAAAFIRWVRQKRIDPRQIDETHAADFLTRLRHAGKDRMNHEKSVLRLLFEFLRRDSGAAFPPRPKVVDPVDDVVGHYLGYLRTVRGLAENSILVYTPFVRDLITDQVSKTGKMSVRGFDAHAIRSFILEHVRGRSGEYARLLATALRSFFRYLFLCGDLSTDLSVAVPTVRKCRHASLPVFLSPQEIERVISATDRSTLTGRRDYAVLLLLARLGLRAGEIALLELDDIRWRSGEILIRGKGRMLEPLPLLADVGEALAQYLRKDRRESDSRRVFQRVYPPFHGFAGPAAIGHIVRLALSRARIHRSGRGAAHLFRHGLATQMIRRGASLAEISEVLRHRSLNSTAVYAQVSFDDLRTVARPWPVTGGCE
jgi:site-specific recombinase XerD